MVIHFEQTQADVECRYRYVVGENTPLFAEIPLKSNGHFITFYANGRPLYHIDTNALASLKNSFKSYETTVQNLCAVLDVSGNPVGALYSRMKKEGFLGIGNYWYYLLDYQGKQFSAYSIGLGRQGMAVPVFHDGAQVALLEKPAAVQDFKDKYEIYLLDETALLPVCLLALYYDTQEFGAVGILTRHYTQTDYVVTRSKELLGLYDPDFKQRVLRRDANG